VKKPKAKKSQEVMKPSDFLKMAQTGAPMPPPEESDDSSSEESDNEELARAEEF